MNGLVCKIKNDEVLYENKEFNPLLVNFVNGISSLGRKLFSEETKMIKIEGICEIQVENEGDGTKISIF